ncbi:hypothetical protein LT493_23690 [Streptomyces tricolor]|nr:hypothetical protein [Streptomyces tricolor]
MKGRTALAALTLLALGGCATGPSLENRGQVTAPPGDSRTLTVGSAGFTEATCSPRCTPCC